MRLKKRAKTKGTCILFLCLFLAGGCAKKTVRDSSEEAGAFSYGDALVTPSIADAIQLNPVLCADSSSGDIVGLLFNGLVKYDKDIKLTGDLAQSWKVTEGGLVITFYLRKGVRWHDGREFTSEDVKFTYERLIDPKVKTPFSSDFERVKSLETPDKYTVVVTYKEPFAPGLASWGMGIVPKHLFEKGDFNTNPCNRRPVGTGPYIFKKWVTDEKIELEANPDYFEGKPFISKYIYRIISDQSVQLSELEKGTVDYMGLNSFQYSTESRTLPEKYQINVFRYSSINSYTYLGYNIESPFFKDVKVRQALACAINKKDMIKGVIQGFGKPITGPYPPAFWAYNNQAREYAYNPDKARRALESLGWKDSDGDGILEKNGIPFRFTLITNQGNKERELCATIIQEDFKKIGIDVSIRILEWSTFLQEYVNKKKFDALILGWNLSLDPDQYSMWHSSQIEKGYNFVSYKNKEVDRLLEEGRKIFDQGKRKKIYNRIHAVLAEEQPYSFLYVRDSFPVIHKRFRGIKVEPAGIEYNFVQWYVPRSEQRYAQ